jgi:hypothetical protein
MKMLLYYILLHLTGNNAWTIPFSLGHIAPGVNLTGPGVNGDIFQVSHCSCYGSLIKGGVAGYNLV